MLITFKTKSYANITMFGEVAQKMLELMDYGVGVPGGIVAEDVSHAFDNLQQGLAQIPEIIEAAGQTEDDQPSVSLHTRAVPLLALLQSALDNENQVRWE